jgi:membrane protein required for colicin V production
VTLFDLAVVLLLLVSGLVGFVRGATRELVTVLAFLGGALVAVFALRFTGPIARAAIDPEWAGNAVAILIVFLAVYILLRVVGASLTKRIHQTKALGSVDRFAGIAVGAVRALVLIGVFHLVFHAATPAERLPTWMTESASYPLSAAAADGLRVVAREGGERTDGLAPALRDAVVDGKSPGQDVPVQNEPADAEPDQR